MTLQQLEYVLAIAEEGSITRAAARLFKAQPNISSSIRELESEIGIQIFERSTNGTHLTPEGESFLVRADHIVRQANQLKTLFVEKNQKNFVFRVYSSRSSYMTSAISKWVNTYAAEHESLHLYLRETHTKNVIETLARAEADLGIIRIPLTYQGYYDEFLSCHQLAQQELMQFPLRICIKNSHPLSRYDVIPFDELDAYTEVIHGDDSFPIIRQAQLNEEFTTKDRNNQRRVYVYDRGSQISVLDEIENAYMWVSPIPVRLLKQYDMQLKECSFAKNINKDIVIYRKEDHNNVIIQSCVASLKQFAKSLQADYTITMP